MCCNEGENELMKRKREGKKEEVVLLSVEVMVTIYIEQEERRRVIKCGEEKTKEKRCPWKASDWMLQPPVTNHTELSFFGIFKRTRVGRVCGQEKERTKNRTASALVYEPKQEVGRHQQKQRKREEITAGFLSIRFYSLCFLVRLVWRTQSQLNTPTLLREDACLDLCHGMCEANTLLRSPTPSASFLRCCPVGVGVSSDLLIWWATLPMVDGPKIYV